ncbi:ROK family transcriptional regulator [Marinibacterium sp. SX1]|uniref:ROK family transcriptional regulator n=1 Tax=Marinibacterium sp. SX1 TaxID=3388424 RepID=UPI003D182A4E
MTEIRRLTSGINQSGVRAYNERLILTMLQRNGPMAGRDLAVQSGLSPQTVSVILRKLEADHLVLRGAPQRGKVGKPSVPVTLNPDGLFSFGLKIGRRSANLALMDFTGAVRAEYRLVYPYPMPDKVFAFLRDGFEAALRDLPAQLRTRVCGIGIAAPFELWNWHDLVGAPAQDFEAWKAVDFRALVRDFTDLPVHVVNDATAACRAELIYGSGKHYRDYAYVYLGAFIGGGVVLNHLVLEGQFGNAGALGSLPITGPDGRTVQLIDVASVHTLEARAGAAGHDSTMLWDMPQNWDSLEDHVAPWIDQTGAALAQACLAACAVIDFEAVLIDGAIPLSIRARLVERIRAELPRLDARGLILPRVEEGRIGFNARAIGAACGPIIAGFLLDEFAGIFASDRAG